MYMYKTMYFHVHVLTTCLPGLGLLMTLKGGEFGTGLLPSLDDVDSVTPLAARLCPVFVGLWPW